MSSFPVLTALGLQPGKPELYETLLLKLQEDTWGPELVTCQFVLELREQVELQDRLSAGVPGQKLTTRQFVHVLAMIGNPKLYPTEDTIPQQIKKKLWTPRDFETLSKKVKTGLVDGATSWPVFIKVFPGAAADLQKAVTLPPAPDEPSGDEGEGTEHLLTTHRFPTFVYSLLTLPIIPQVSSQAVSTQVRSFTSPRALGFQGSAFGGCCRGPGDSCCYF